MRFYSAIFAILLTGCVTPELRDQFERTLQRTEQLEKELSVARTVVDSLERGASDAKATIAALEARVESGDGDARRSLDSARRQLENLRSQVEAAKIEADSKKHELDAVQSNVSALNTLIQEQKDAIAARVSTTAGSLVGSAARSAFGLPPTVPTGPDAPEEGTNPTWMVGLAAIASQFFRRPQNGG